MTPKRFDEIEGAIVDGGAAGANMDEQRRTDQTVKRRDFAVLCVTLMALVGLGLGFWACGEDLMFPGQIPFTPTPGSTATAGPTQTPTQTP